MLQNYTIEVEGVKLDTNSDFGISLNYQIEEIFDITKRMTNYSKTIELPGTPKNNKFFQQLFDVNIDTLFYNPSISAKPAVVRIGDNAVFEGSLQLININNVQGDIIYEIAIFGNLNTILNQITDYELPDLTGLDKYNHIRTRENIADSWSHNIFVNGTKQLMPSGTGYVYPMIKNNFDSNNETPNVLLTHNQLPAVYIKTIIDEIFEDSGYTYTSEFFNSDYFKKLIMPFNADKIELSLEETDKRTVRVGVLGSGPEFDGASGPAVGTGYQSFTSSAFYPGNGWYRNSDFNYYMPLSRETGVVGSVDFQDNQNQWNNYGGWVCQDAGFYDLKLDLKLFAEYLVYADTKIRFNGSRTWKYYYRIIKKTSSGDNIILGESSIPIEVAPSDDDWHDSPWLDLNTPLVMSKNVDNVYMEVGEKFLIQMCVNYTLDEGEWQVNLMPDLVYMKLKAKESYDGQPSHLIIEPSSNASYGHEEVELRNTLPKIKQKDFLLDIIKMFNLVVVDDTKRTNNLLIEPRDDYFRSKQKVRNWDDILDEQSEVIISPMGEVDARSYILTYKEDSDFYNEEYLNETKQVYGSLRIDIDNDFSYQENKLEVLFAATPDSSQYLEEMVAPFFAEMSGVGEFKSKKVKPRILFYDGLKDVRKSTDSSVSDTITLLDFETQDDDTYVYNQYPYTGMWDDPYNPTYDLGFGRTEKVYWDIDKFPTNNLYEMFHRSTIENITDINAKILEATFHLTPKEIAEFDFRDVIFLQGQYWRVMKIKDFNPAGADTLTKVILYKIVNYETFLSSSEEALVVTKPCPTKVVAVKTNKDGWVYVSEHGEVGKECCKYLKGSWDASKGICIAKKLPPKPVNPFEPVKPIKFPYGGPYVTPSPEPYGPAVLKDRKNTFNSPTVKVNGRNNFVSKLTENVSVFGNNNTVLNGVKDTIVIGDGITAKESGSIYLENVRINSEGRIFSTSEKIIDGGEDVVFPYTKTNGVDIIDGGFDSVRNPNGDVKNRVIIDGTNGESIDE